jgi:hypothetical protein
VCLFCSCSSSYPHSAGHPHGRGEGKTCPGVKELPSGGVWLKSTQLLHVTVPQLCVALVHGSHEGATYCSCTVSSGNCFSDSLFQLVFQLSPTAV